MNLKILVTLVALIFLLISCSSCKNTEHEESAEMEKTNIDKKFLLANNQKLPMGALQIQASVEDKEIEKDSEYFDAVITKIIRRGQGAPVVNVNDKVKIKFSMNQKVSVTQFDEETKLIIKKVPSGRDVESETIWQLISVE
jgi:hypothetical protein